MKSLMKSLLLLLVSSVIALLLGEVSVRLVAPQQLIHSDFNLWRSDSTMGYNHIANLDTIFNGGEGDHHFITDDQGYRINGNDHSQGSLEKPDLTILGIGDSFLEAVSVENSETVPEVVARALSQRYQLKVKAVNGGVAGWNPNNYYKQTVRSLGLKKYDLGLVFLYIGNDCVSRIDTIFQATRPSTEPPRRLKRSVSLYKWWMASVFSPIRGFLERHSHLSVLAKHQAYNFFSRLGRTMGYMAPVHHLREKNSPVWEVTTQLCFLIDREFARRNVPAFFVLLPTLYQTYPQLFDDYIKFLKIDPDSMDLDQPNKMLAVHFAQKSLTLIDTTPYLRQKGEQGTKLYGTMDRHMNAAGHEAVAEFCLPYVEAALKLSTSNR